MLNINTTTEDPSKTRRKRDLRWRAPCFLLWQTSHRCCKHCQAPCRALSGIWSVLGKAQLFFCNHTNSTGIWGRFSRASAPLPDVSLFFFPWWVQSGISFCLTAATPLSLLGKASKSPLLKKPVLFYRQGNWVIPACTSKTPGTEPRAPLI